ncbi:MAG: T9SS type A sorting domain-containing protein, partial [Bacteroidia bacterium]|nr:T9SS type A sorting domain-containing protein [Bacteroidia bacterium]
VLKQKQEIITSGFPAGIYFLRLQNGAGQMTVKIFKE